MQFKFAKRRLRLIDRNYDHVSRPRVKIPTWSEADGHLGLIGGKADSPNERRRVRLVIGEFGEIQVPELSSPSRS